MPFILPPPPQNSGIGDQLAKALLSFVVARHEKESYDYNKQAHQFALKKMQFDEHKSQMDAATQDLLNKQSIAKNSIMALTGQDPEAIPPAPNPLSLDQAVPSGPTNLEDFMANKGPELNSAPRLTGDQIMGGVGKLPTIQYPTGDGTSVGITPDSKQQVLEDYSAKLGITNKAAAQKAGEVTAATQKAKIDNPTGLDAKTLITADNFGTYGLPPETIGKSLTQREIKQASTTKQNSAMMSLRQESLADREKARVIAASRPGALRTVITTDDSGNPVTQLVRENKQTGDVEVVKSYPRPLGMMEHRLVDTNVAIVNTADKVKEDLKDPKIRDIIGTFASRGTSLKDMIGILPPEAGQLQADLHALSLAIPGAHTLRSQEAAKSIYEFLNKPNPPDVMEAKLNGLLTFPLAYIETAGKGAAGLKRNQTPTSSKYKIEEIK